MSNWDFLLDDFSSYIASEKGLSKHSVEAYQRDIAQFFSFVKLKVSSLNELKEEDIVLYLQSIQQLASSSIARKLIAIKVLCRFLKRENLLESNIALYLETPKIWQQVPEVLSLEEMERLLNNFDLTTKEGVRNKAIIELLYATGMRVSELCSIKIYDVADDFVKVMGKGRKERLVPLGKKALEAIDLYLTTYRAESDSETIKDLFVNNKGKPVDRSFVWKIVKEAAKEANILKNISPHTFRHSFATHLLNNGADLRVIQDMLGHSSISSTDRYTQISSKHLQDSFNRCHLRK